MIYKGFGFIEMPNNSEADQAIKALNGKFIQGKHLKVNQANPGGKRSKRSFKRSRYKSHAFQDAKRCENLTDESNRPVLCLC